MNKTIIKLIIGVMLITSSVSNVYGGLINSYVADTSSDNKCMSIVEYNVGLYYEGSYINLSKPTIIAGGRLYLPMRDIATALGGELKKEGTNFKLQILDRVITVPIAVGNENVKDVVYSKGVAYINMFKLLDGLDIVPVFDSSIKRITLYKKQATKKYDIMPKGTEKTAYIRLEDIMADGVDKCGVYTDTALEKLRFMADYMGDRAQEFYIAWIPVYVNPKTGVVNDISVDYNFYNASFVYTLDYMIARGGHIGLHGYTHQYGDEKSADGFEFGENTPYSDIECMTRMVKAKTVAYRLGFSEEFFEFPHYGATQKQFEMAEHYFDVIYQPHPKEALKNSVTYTENENGKTYYIPTPAEYIYYRDDVMGAKLRLEKAVKNGWAVSLFFHPNIDFKDIEVCVKDNTRIWSYNEDRVLPQLIEKVLSEGYSFGALKK